MTKSQLSEAALNYVAAMADPDATEERRSFFLRALVVEVAPPTGPTPEQFRCSLVADSREQAYQEFIANARTILGCSEEQAHLLYEDSSSRKFPLV